MSRRSRRKQNRRKQYKSGKERKRIQWKNCTVNSTSKLSTLEGTRLGDNFLTENSIRLSCESDSDPDLCYDFFPDTEAYKSKSDSALNKLFTYSSDVSTFDGDATREGSGIEQFQPTLTTCSKVIMNDMVSSSTDAGNLSSVNLKNRIRTFSLSHVGVNVCRGPRENFSEINVNGESFTDKETSKLEDFLRITLEKKNISCSAIVSENKFGESEKEERMRSFEDGRGAPTYDPATLKSSSSLFEGKSSKKQIFSNNCSNEDCSFQLFGNLPCCEGSDKDSPHSKESTGEKKIYLERTKTEKQMLNCSLLQSEPKNKSTPIIKTPRQNNRKMSSPDLTVIMKNNESDISSTSNVNKKEEYHSCSKEFFSKDDSVDEDESLCPSCYVSCREFTNRSEELLKIRPLTTNFKYVKCATRDMSVQCELLLPHEARISNESDGIHVEKRSSCETSVNDFLIKNALNEFETKLKNVTFSSKVNEANDLSWGVNEVSTNDLDISSSPSDEAKFQTRSDFETFSRLFTRSSIQRFLHALSVLPFDKILEFFCLTFSIPFIETMAISISVTKVMNVLSAVISFPNFSNQIKSYGSKAADYLKAGIESFTDLFIKVQVEEVNVKKECTCYCDVKKLTDMEKRLKNLENELTKFQLVDKEIDKLRQVAKSLEQAAVAAATASTPAAIDNSRRISDIPPPPPPPPLPPPPPPPPPLPPSNLIAPAVKLKKDPQKQNPTTRPSITVEDLQKVTLRKVVTNDKPTIEKKGPFVSMEMLRAVKLRSCSRKKGDTCSPTRTPISRDRIRKMKSPAFRSSSRSSERKPRFSNIPLSKILNMDDTYEFTDNSLNDKSGKE